jgi:hypothetical protein
MSSQTNNDQFKLENLFNVKVSSSVLYCPVSFNANDQNRTKWLL